jgi:hypothetical protein
MRFRLIYQTPNFLQMFDNTRSCWKDFELETAGAENRQRVPRGFVCAGAGRTSALVYAPFA